jgi:hypothetical protein
MGALHRREPIAQSRGLVLERLAGCTLGRQEVLPLERLGCDPPLKGYGRLDLFAQGEAEVLEADAQPHELGFEALQSTLLGRPVDLRRPAWDMLAAKAIRAVELSHGLRTLRREGVEIWLSSFAPAPPHPLRP